jgi:hypothetical protein
MFNENQMTVQIVFSTDNNEIKYIIKNEITYQNNFRAFRIEIYKKKFIKVSEEIERAINFS